MTQALKAHILFKILKYRREISEIYCQNKEAVSLRTHGSEGWGRLRLS